MASLIGQNQLSDALNNIPVDNENTDAPQAYLNILFLKEDLSIQADKSKRIQVTTLSKNDWQAVKCQGCLTERIGVTVDEGGYLLIIVSNNSIGKDVWFDNISIQHERGYVLEENHYYPFGLTITSAAAGVTNQPLKYQTKELERSFGLETYDFHARQYDPQLGRFTSVDPLADMLASMSPYCAMGNNPVIYIDPDGRKIVISGDMADEAKNQLQSRAGNSITISRDEKSGSLKYTANKEGKLKGAAKLIAKMIDDESITVNLLANETTETSKGGNMVVGAFMGNNVKKDKNGKVEAVEANQEYNPIAARKADRYTKNPGEMVMHEVTEAYEGALISKKTGEGVGPATNEDLNNPNSVYSRAHSLATPQSPVIRVLFDKNGKVTKYPQKAVRLEYRMNEFDEKSIIQIAK